MWPIEVVATGSVSAAGLGLASFGLAPVAAHAPSALGDDDALRSRGLAQPVVARAPLAPDVQDRTGQLLRLAAAQLRGQLTLRMPGFQSAKVGLVVGTSAGKMDQQQQVFQALAAGLHCPPEAAAAALYSATWDGLADDLGVHPSESCLVLGACASSSFAIGLGARWLEAGYVDLVIAGGVDALSELVCAGFEALGITSEQPLPFGVARNGMALGEAACLLALRRATFPLERKPYLVGFGCSSDAYHITAPDPAGRGLVEAAQDALSDAKLFPEQIELLSTHGTCTPHNDQSEALAARCVFGEREVPAIAHKPSLGHTLGASGALEFCALLEAMARGVHPASGGVSPKMSDLSLRLTQRTTRLNAGWGMKWASAFGGLNVALVCGFKPAPPLGAPLSQFEARTPALVYQYAASACEAACEALPAWVSVPESRWPRLDEMTRLVISASLPLSRFLSPEALARSGNRIAVIVGTRTACLEHNRAFYLPLLERGLGAAPPRLFAATSPNLPAAQCAIAFGLRGPALSVATSDDAGTEAHALAWDLVAFGDVDSALVIVAEVVGDAGRSAFLARRQAVPAQGARAYWLSLQPVGEGLARPRQDPKPRGQL